MCSSFLRNTSSLLFVFLIISFLPTVDAAPVKGSHVKIYVSSLPYIYTSHAVNGALLRPANNERGWEYYMATSHSQISDTVYEFKLRQGVQFQDGTPFNADAVIENMEYFKKKPFLFSKINTVYDHAEKIDDYTVRFYLKEKYGTFLNDVIWIQFYTTKYLKKFGWNGKATCPNLAEAGPYGLGPYILSEGYIEGDRKTDKAVLIAALIMPWSIVAKPPQASGRGALPVEVVVEPAKPAKACVQALAQTKADEVVQRSVPPGWSHQIGRWRNYAAP